MGIINLNTFSKLANKTVKFGPFLVQVSKAAHLGMVKRAGNRPNTSARSSSIPFAIAAWTNRFANLPAPACGIFILTELVHCIQSTSVKGHDIPAKSRVRIVHFFYNIPKFSHRFGMYPYFCILLTYFATVNYQFDENLLRKKKQAVKKSIILYVICQVTTTLIKWQSFYLIFQTHHLTDNFKILPLKLSKSFQLLCSNNNNNNNVQQQSKNLKIKHQNRAVISDFNEQQLRWQKQRIKFVSISNEHRFQYI
ncbi:hypothetical protein T10_5006 [Trichinella papuae]|uniref:Uncharacterized protein n=1 Tax=Trichinella papuae TaxID=268474 RepID=A0A0V1N2H7_9BILA|nr:hypothetical protein T10_5006 [Trichinella papuae]